MFMSKSPSLSLSTSTYLSLSLSLPVYLSLCLSLYRHICIYTYGCAHIAAHVNTAVSTNPYARGAQKLCEPLQVLLVQSSVGLLRGRAALPGQKMFFASFGCSYKLGGPPETPKFPLKASFKGVWG